MKMTYLQVKRLSQDAVIPQRAYEGDAGIDLFCNEDFELPPKIPVRVSTGISLAVESGHVGLICDRSSMGKKGIKVLGGVIDSGYRGEILVMLQNLTEEPYKFEKGSKIAQMLILPIATPHTLEVETLEDSPRGERGFGSSGQ